MTALCQWDASLMSGGKQNPQEAIATSSLETHAYCTKAHGKKVSMTICSET